MMSRRTLLALMGLVFGLGLLWLYSLYRQVPRHKVPYAGVSDQATGVVLKQDNRTIVLKKQAEGWQVASSEQGPFFRADDGRVGTLLSGVESLQLDDVISDQANRASDFEVDTVRGIRVTLHNDKGGVLADGVFGKQAPDFVHLYFRFPDQATVWLTRGMIRGELGGMDYAGWRNHTLLTLSEPQIQAVDLQQKGVTTSLVLSSTTWLIGGKLADANRVNQMLGALAHLQAVDYADPVTGPAWDSLKDATIVVKSSGTTVTLRIGAHDVKRKQYPVAYSQHEGVAWVDDARMKDILLKPSDLRAK